MHQLFSEVRWNISCDGRTFIWERTLDFAVQTLLVKLECSLTLAIEIKIRIQFHTASFAEPKIM